MSVNQKLLTRHVKRLGFVARWEKKFYFYFLLSKNEEIFYCDKRLENILLQLVKGMFTLQPAEA